MRLRILYGLLAAALVLWIATVLGARHLETAQQPVPESAPVSQAAAPAAGALTTPAFSSGEILPSHVPGITVLNPRKRKKTVTDLSESPRAYRGKPPTATRSSSSAAAGAAATAAEAADTDGPETGITRLGNRPTKEQQQSMREQGIVLY